MEETQTIDKQRYLKRLSALKNERSSWIEHWRELSDYIQPRRGRFVTSDRNSGTKKNSNIINGTATWASRVLASGMMAGVTSPARKWFRLSVPNPVLNESDSVRSWLYEVEDRIRHAFSKSNLYTGLHILYSDLINFGTGAMLVEEDDEDWVRSYTIPIGQYCLANSTRMQIDTMYREFSMTTEQLIEKFGKEACSRHVQTEYENKNFDSWNEILHVIEPNRDFKEGSIGPPGKRYKSTWMELRDEGGSKKALSVSGYESFPIVAPRWFVTGEDIYGSSPAMEALGDIRALQLLEKRKAQLVDKLVNPPMRAPTSLLSQRASLLPGDITYVDAIGQGQTFSPAMEVNPNSIGIVDSVIREHEARIRTAFYADLWLMLASKPDSTMTAREVVERSEEKALQLGPVLERLGDELLDPLITRVFAILLRQGHIPIPPEELQGIELKVEYVSVMAQAQKAVGVGSVERFISFISTVGGAKPEIMDKVDFDQLVDEYSEMIGAPPSIVRSDDMVSGIREERAAMQQRQMQLEQTEIAAKSAKSMSQAKLEDDSALKRVMESMSPFVGTKA